MKWKRTPMEFLPEKTFLIIKDDLEALAVNCTVKEPAHRKKSKSAADTGTWPPKIKKLGPYGPKERPKTANLERPSVLDPSLVNKLDMSLLSKEVLSDSMTQLRHGLQKLGGDRHSTADTKTFRQKRRSFEHVLLDQPLVMRRQVSPDVRRLDANNNRNKVTSSLSTVRMVKSSRPAEIEVFTGLAKTTPEPCTTCGRPDQPERLHSHPKGVLPTKIIANSGKPKEITKKTTQKPVALNFQSEKTKSKSKELSPASSKDLSSEKIRESSASMRKGPRTVTCYICAREFGTASFPIHEPKCMQKWERENSSLPPSQKRSPPQRPIVPIDHQEWNTAAWQLSQTQLVPCWKCGRTFLPDRLPVHQKSCKAPAKQNSASSKSDRSDQSGSSNARGVSTIQCEVCGRNFGSTSIKIHEPQCLRRWQSENEGKKEPPRRQESGEKVSSSNPLQKKTVTCYICGRDFGSTSIEIHEPQCLKKWHMENGKLPPNQRRQEPQKPEVVLSSASTPGNPVVDWTATSEARWRSHLGQLVACKNCKRTFNPDRVAIHERTCKSTR
ncbi:zinc finger protein 474 isoform X1 [Fopius arisanus]|uniref:Zinc finger protein 474 isoform X1 n=1 Tax=Fopius arisanus TaxID=64838 RepID=A0A9R1U4Z5_9HYME|nr:PREDICTED: zinc finger protein 474-like isoform X1 [Fopius arisanus]